MAGELATVEQHGVATISYTRDQIELLKRTICIGATDDELQLFLMRVKATGLDPFAKQIYAVKRPSKGGGSKMTIQTGIDGYRCLAIRTREADGQDGPYWCGEDGVWKDVWLDQKQPPFAAKITVFRKGHSRGYVGVAHMQEYYQAAGGMWDNLPVTMIAKVAETIALRKAFPQELSGIYTDDEMPAEPRQADVRTQSPTSPPPALPVPTKEMLREQTDRTGRSWAWCIRAINSNGSTYPETTKASELPPEVLAGFFEWLCKQPDKQPANTEFAQAGILTLDQWAERLEVSSTVEEAKASWDKVPAAHRAVLRSLGRRPAIVRGGGRAAYRRSGCSFHRRLSA